jgi:hypothetical protein
MRLHLRLNATFGDQDPSSIRVSDVQEWIAANADLKPSSLRAVHRNFAADPRSRERRAERCA